MNVQSPHRQETVHGLQGDLGRIAKFVLRDRRFLESIGVGESGAAVREEIASQDLNFFQMALLV
jgi:hypothetical protein